MSVEIIYPSEPYLQSFYDALTLVAAERIYIEMVKPLPFEQVAEFQRSLFSKNGPVFYAVDGQKVVGWCDIFSSNNPRTSHRGSLGMGCLPDYRGRGVGSRLLDACLKQAKAFGLEKVELHVYTSNVNAIRLYEKFGFEREGLIRNYRKLDGQYFDCVAMGKFL